MNEYIFTFGGNHALEGTAQKIRATNEIKAREIMCENYEDKWCSCYTIEHWKEMENNPNRCWPMEQILPKVLEES